MIGDGESIDNKHSLWWRDIISMGSLANNNSNRFVCGVKLRLGGGEKIKLWREKWLGTEPLMHVFPRLYSVAANKQNFRRLYSVAANKHASVAECGVRQNGMWLEIGVAQTSICMGGLYFLHIC